LFEDWFSRPAIFIKERWQLLLLHSRRTVLEPGGHSLRTLRSAALRRSGEGIAQPPAAYLIGSVTSDREIISSLSFPSDSL